LIVPINVGTFEAFKRNGLDLLADHRDDFPPEYLHWIDEGYRWRTPDLMRDEELRSEIYDAIQGASRTTSCWSRRRSRACPFRTPTTATLPAGMAEGLPVGMQLIGRRYADADVLAASAAFERLRPWRDGYAAVMAST
jgi:amidase/aspartyl-tRNA(Asn)/glutamyl-tRNA(Gln) amidotransferase subunit A